MPSIRVWIVDGRDFVVAGATVPTIPPSLVALLGEDERARLQRFPKPQRAREFLLGRLLLRHALIQTLGCAPHEIAVEERLGASPRVTVAGTAADGRTLPGLSLSHSRGWLACVIGETCPVGVDIEAPAPQRDLDALAALAFTAAEIAWLARQAARQPAFYQLWCAKEALYKFRHNAGMDDTQGLPPLECGGDGPEAGKAFLHRESDHAWHLCLCSGERPASCTRERIDYAQLLNLSQG